MQLPQFSKKKKKLGANPTLCYLGTFILQSIPLKKTHLFKATEIFVPVISVPSACPKPVVSAVGVGNVLQLDGRL